MKSKISIGILITLCVVSSAFAYIQKVEADRQNALAIEAAVQAEKYKLEAERSHIVAEHNRVEAERQRAIAERAVTSRVHVEQQLNELKKKK